VLYFQRKTRGVTAPKEPMNVYGLKEGDSVECRLKEVR
jgi:hypothetical protein